MKRESIETKGTVSRAASSAPLTVEHDDRLLERQGVPDLHLAVGSLQNPGTQEEYEGRCLLNALEHALLGQVVGSVVVPHLLVMTCTQVWS